MSGIMEDECWVCGTLTKDRCSACTNRNPVVDVFLCSKTCQKLVNPIHRVFCGTEEIKRKRSTRLQNRQASPDTIQNRLEGLHVYGTVEQEAFIDHLTGQEPDPVLETQAFDMIAIIRAELHALRFEHEAGRHLSPTEFAVGFCAQVFVTTLRRYYFDGEGALLAEPLAFLAPLYHRFAILGSIDSPQFRPCTDYVQSLALHRYIEKPVTPADAECAPSLCELLVGR